MRSYKRHRSSAEIIAHTVWLYFRFSLRFRDVEALMAARGVILSYETVRRWTKKFGQQYANELKRRRPLPGDKWHIDEAFLTIQGKTAYSVQSRRNKAAAKKFFRRLVKGCTYVPRVLITDKPPVMVPPSGRSCGASSTDSTNG